MLTGALECFHDIKLCGFLSVCSSYQFGLNHIQHLISPLSSLTSLLCYLPLPPFIFVFPSLLSLPSSLLEENNFHPVNPLYLHPVYDIIVPLVKLLSPFTSHCSRCEEVQQLAEQIFRSFWIVFSTASVV